MEVYGARTIKGTGHIAERDAGYTCLAWQYGTCGDQEPSVAFRCVRSHQVTFKGTSTQLRLSALPSVCVRHVGVGVLATVTCLWVNMVAAQLQARPPGGRRAPWTEDPAKQDNSHVSLHIGGTQSE